MHKKRKNLKVIIPAAGNGTRGYPATTGFGLLTKFHCGFNGKTS